MYGKAPNLWTFSALKKTAEANSCEVEEGKWAPARPLGLDTWGTRIRLAWLVFKGVADALVWPQDEHLLEEKFVTVIRH